jgi:hypothetical protein
MGDKISIYPEKMPDGAILFEIKVKDPSLIGKKASFSIKRKVSVKDSRPVHGSNVLFKFSFNVNSTNKIRVSAANMKNTSGSFPYSGSKISIKTIAEVKVTTALVFKTTTRFSLSNYVAGDLPKRAEVKRDPKKLIDPKDSFNFFNNLGSIPLRNQTASLILIIFGTAILMINLWVGYHDQISPEHQTWFYSHNGSDGDSSSPLFNAFWVSTLIAIGIWWGMKNQFRKYMAFHFKPRIRKIDRASTVNVADLVTGRSRVDLIDPVLRVVACNMEKGQYIRGYGSNRRTRSFSHPNRAVLLFSRRVPIIPKGAPIHQYFDEEFSFKPMFEALYPRQMVSSSHGLDLVWEVQLIVADLVDQELIGNPDAFVQKDFYSA